MQICTYNNLLTFSLTLYLCLTLSNTNFFLIFFHLFVVLSHSLALFFLSELLLNSRSPNILVQVYEETRRISNSGRFFWKTEIAQTVSVMFLSPDTMFKNINSGVWIDISSKTKYKIKFM